MEIAVHILIALGAAIMVVNIVRYIFFARSMNDTLTAKNKKVSVWLTVGLVLLIFFLAGYIVVEVVFDPALITAFILFFGAVFVAVMLTISSTLNKVAKRRSLQITNLLVDVVDARDPNLNGHSSHVKALAVLFLSYLPKDKKKGIKQIDLEYAAVLHDIGKLGIPEAILNKPGKLTDEEWVLMKNHPKIGVKFLEPIESFEKVSPWILYHHERVDGKGYYGKYADEVPFVSKMLAICDTYSAITMRRSYKEPRTHEEAIKIIREVAGTQLDSELVDIFVNIPKEELEKCIPEKIKN